VKRKGEIYYQLRYEWLKNRLLQTLDNKDWSKIGFGWGDYNGLREIPDAFDHAVDAAIRGGK